MLFFFSGGFVAMKSIGSYALAAFFLAMGGWVIGDF
tara:strand:- start:5832 stop:5939 length:108 start_codon:yes stop_codon:yes gene_type:complete